MNKMSSLMMAAATCIPFLLNSGFAADTSFANKALINKMGMSRGNNYLFASLLKDDSQMCENKRMTIKKIKTIGSESEATIEYGDKRNIKIRTGDELPCGETVLKITPESVMIKVKKRVIFLLLPE